MRNSLQELPDITTEEIRGAMSNKKNNKYKIKNNTSPGEGKGMTEAMKRRGSLLLQKISRIFMCFQNSNISDKWHKATYTAV